MVTPEPATGTTSAMAAATRADAEEIRQLARTFQYDRYIAALLLPRRHREALIVLAAFAGELQRIPVIVSEPMMAALRFQWWRDELMAAAVPNAGERRIGHPLCDAVMRVAREQRLPFGLLQGMLDAAEVELDPTPLADAGEMRQILTKFDGALFELAGHILGAETSRDVWPTAAMAYGGARLASELCQRQAAGAQTYLSQTCRDVEQAFVMPAEAALAELRGRLATFDRGTRGALLPLATVPPLLRGVASQNQQTDAVNNPISDFARARHILWAHWRGRI